jgi:hypothetical protein
LHKSDLYHLVNGVDGVDYVDDVRLYREAATLPVDRVEIAAEELLFPAAVNVVELVRERLV